MDDKSINNKQNETRSKLMGKLLPYIRKNGFKSLTMDEISKLMGVSRGTLYKYFSTKEDIVEFIVRSCVEYTYEIIDDTDVDRVSARFQQIFEQSVLLIEYITDIFLKELENSYPEKYECLKKALKLREKQIIDFLNEGIRNGIFNDVNGKIIIMQDEILRNLLDVRYLMENNLTVEKVIFDYYIIKKFQLFKPEKIQTVDDNVMMPKIEYISRKITKNLF